MTFICHSEQVLANELQQLRGGDVYASLTLLRVT